MELTSRPKSRENAWLWLTKLAAGVLVFVVITIHMVVNHLVYPQGLLSYQDVINYYQNPIIPIMEIGFLIFVVVHALLGVRSILLDLNPSDRVLSGINLSLITLGTGAIIYGIWLIIVLVSRGSS